MGADVISCDSLTSVSLRAELHVIHFSFAPREDKKQPPRSPRSEWVHICLIQFRGALG